MADALPPIFDGLDDKARWSALRHFQRIEVDYGAQLMAEGDDDPSIIFVMSGELEVRTGETSLGKIGVGEVVGEGALFGSGQRMAQVESMMPSVLMLLERSGYQALVQENHPIARSIERLSLDNLVSRLREADERIAKRAEGADARRVVPGPGFFARIASLVGTGGQGLLGSFDAAAVLATSKLFDGAPEAAIAEVGNAMRTQSWRAGQFLCTEGERGNAAYFLASGQVDVIVHIDKSDKVEAVATLQRGDFFGAGGLIDDRPRVASCVAKGDVDVLKLDRASGQKLIQGTTPGGRALRVALIRAFTNQLAFANAQVARIDLELLRRKMADLRPLMLASAGIETYGRYQQGG